MIERREEMITNYIGGYNSFDVDRMVEDFHKAIVFRNIENDEETMLLKGIDAFKQQAENAKSYFENRIQKIKSFKHENNKTEIEIDYMAVLKTDLPDSFKKGDQLKFEGISIFRFTGDKIIELTDIF